MDPRYEESIFTNFFLESFLEALQSGISCGHHAGLSSGLSQKLRLFSTKKNLVTGKTLLRVFVLMNALNAIRRQFRSWSFTPTVYLTSENSCPVPMLRIKWIIVKYYWKYFRMSSLVDKVLPSVGMKMWSLDEKEDGQIPKPINSKWNVTVLVTS